MRQKCECQSAKHDHEAGKCDRPAMRDQTLCRLCREANLVEETLDAEGSAKVKSAMDRPNSKSQAAFCSPT
jgi:hypothetical protein